MKSAKKSTIHPIRRSFPAMIVVSLGLTHGAWAATITWTGGAGSWHTAANWDLNRVPAAQDDVVIPAGAGPVTYSTGSITVDSLQADRALTVSGGTLNIDTNGASCADLTLSGSATLGGAGDVTVNGAMSWTGTATMSGAGKTIIAAGGSLSISDVSAKNLQRVLDNHSLNATWTDGNIVFLNGTLNNAADGTFTATLAASRSFSNGGGINAVNNAGTFSKAGAGTLSANSGVPFNNTGTVSVQGGTLAAVGGGTSNGDFDVSASAAISFNGTHVIDTGASLTGAGTLSVIGGTTTFTDAPAGAGNLAITGGIANFNGTGGLTGLALALSGGTLGGTGLLTISGSLNWTGTGTMSGSGQTIIAADGSLSISDTNSKNLQRVLDNHSLNATWTDGNIVFLNGTLNNAADGTFTATLAASRSFSNGGGINAVNNAGTFNKAGAATLTANSGIPFNNTGTVHVQAGTLNPSGGGTNSNVIDISSGANLSPSTTYTFAAGSSTTGAGNFNVTSTLTCTGAVSLGCVTNLTGTLNGAGDVTIDGTLNWTGTATMSGAGKTIIAAGGSLSISDVSAKNLQRVLDNHSLNATWTDGNIVFLNGTLNNAADGTFTATLAASRSFSNGGGINAVNNAGTFSKAGAGTLSANSGVPFNNTGTVSVQGGTLAAVGGGTSNGDFDVSASAAISFNGTHVIDTGASLTGAGTLSVIGGTTTFTDAPAGAGNLAITGGIANFNGTGGLTGLALALSGGTLGGTGLLTISGSLNWTGTGTMSGSGQTIIAADGSLSISDTNSKNLQRVLDNHSLNATWTDGNIVFLNGTLNNAADGTFTATLAASRSFSNGGGINAVNNAGTFNKAGAATLTANSGIPFNNTGTVHVQAGTLNPSGGGTNSNVIDISSGANLSPSTTYTFAAGSSTTGAGNFNVTSTLTCTGAVSLGCVTNLTGTLNGAGDVTIDGTLNWTGTATMSGAGKTIIAAGGSLSISDVSAKNLQRVLDNHSLNATWTDGNIVFLNGTLNNAADGTFTATLAASRSFSNGGGINAVNNAGTFSKAGAATLTVNSPIPFSNTGTVNVQAGILSLSGGLTNFSGSTLTGGTYIVAGTLRFTSANIVTNAATIILDGAASAIQNTSGVDALANFATNAAAGSFQIKNGRNYARTGAFNNAGQVRIGPGASTLSATGDYVQTAGGTTLDGGTLDPTDLADIQDGELKGNGSILGNVTNAGMCKVGLSPGSISITGDYTQTVDGVFEAEIGGLTAGTNGFDQLVVSGTASLAGALDVLLFGGFEPEVDDFFDVIVAGTRSGSFDTHNLPLPFSQNCKGGPEYGATYVRINTYAQIIINDQPDTQAICSGDPVTFAVSVSGSGPFIYQWRVDGEDILDATDPSYTISDVQPDDAGDYDVIVTNICRFENSAAAALTVNVAPSFSDDPDSQTLCSGSNVNFSVTASGVPAPTYQWRKNGIDINGETGTTLSLTDVQPGDAGSYDCVATNVCDNPASAPAVLTVNTPAQVDDDPDPVVICSGNNTSFSVIASGTPAPTYQWRKNGANIDGETGPTLDLTNVQPGDAGGYDCVVTNVCATDTSAAATLTVNVAPSVSDDPDSQTVCSGDDVTFAVTASGTPAPTYQWRKGGANIDGETNSTLNLTDVQPGDAGSYDCVVTNVCGNPASAPATLTVNVAPSVSDDPDSQTVCSGANVTFSITASGTPAPTYQWRKDGIDIGGETGSTLNLTNVQPADAGSYDCVVTNVCGNPASAPAVLTVDTGPAISLQPMSQSIDDGDPAIFSVTASGTAPLSYQWRKDGLDLADGPAAGGGTLSGSTTDTLTIDAVGLADEGDYDVEIDNVCSSGVSDPATLTVVVPSAVMTAAVSRKANPAGPGGLCDLGLIPGVTSEPHQGGITELRLTFDIPPGGPGANPIAIEEATCAAPSYVPYSGASVLSASKAGNVLVLSFTPGLENARTYRIGLEPSVTSSAGQFLEVSGLVADASGDGLVNAADRSAVVGVWTGTGFSCRSDVNSSGQTNAADRSAVVGAWTNPAGNCAP